MKATQLASSRWIEGSSSEERERRRPRQQSAHDEIVHAVFRTLGTFHETCENKLEALSRAGKVAEEYLRLVRKGDCRDCMQPQISARRNSSNLLRPFS